MRPQRVCKLTMMTDSLEGPEATPGPAIRRTADLVVIGAGPAGLAAAGTAAARGAKVLLLDEQPQVGGQIYRNIASSTAARNTVLGSDYVAGSRLLRALDEPGISYQPGAKVWQLTDQREVYYSVGTRATMCVATEVVIATGALERPMPFAGWTSPGVMTAGAAQIMLKSGLVPEHDIVLAGSGPLLLLLAVQLHRAGVNIRALVDTTPRQNRWRAAPFAPQALLGYDYLLKGLRLQRDFAATGIDHLRHANDLRAVGGDAISALEFSAGGVRRSIECELLLTHVGVVPNVQLTRSIRAEHEWHGVSQSWQPLLDHTGQCSVAGVSVAGDGAGIAGAEAAALAGELCAFGALARIGLLSASQGKRRIAQSSEGLRRLRAGRPFIEALFAPASEFLNPPDSVVICRCEEVTAGQLREHVALGCLGPNQAKAFSRCGMGPCQGRYCGLTVAQVIAAARGVTPQAVGYYRLRPPLKPVTLGELASLDEDDQVSSAAQVL
jgi:NADPH-dependent 2,4-dienoyl-CoA reductase/sulfur reductase-like enzyme